MDQGVGELLILNKTKFTQDLRPRVLFYWKRQMREANSDPA